MTSIDELIKNLNLKQFKIDWEYGLSYNDIEKKHKLRNTDQVKRITKYLNLKDRENISNKTKFFNALDIDKFSQMYLDPKIKIKDIKDEFGFPHRDYVNDFANRLGLLMRKFGPAQGLSKFSTYKEQFEKLWLEGITIKEITRTLGITDITVFLWKKKLGLPNRRPGKKSGHKPTEEIKKIVDSIEKRLDIITLSELATETKISVKQLEEFISKTDSLDILHLIFSNKTKLKSKSIFGDYAGDKIIFLKNDYDSLLLKIFEIISKARFTPSNEELSFIIDELSIRHHELKLRKEKLHDLFLDTSFDRYDKYALKTKLNSLLKEKFLSKAKDTLSIESLKNRYFVAVNEDDDFGYVANPHDFLHELNNSDRNGQILLIKSLFYSLGFQILNSRNESDFEIFAETKIPVKLEIYRSLTKIDISIFSNRLGNREGIIITLQPLDESIDSETIGNITIFDKDRITENLLVCKYLPARIGKIAQIRVGDEYNKGKIVVVEKILFEQNFSQVKEFSRGTILRVPIFSLKEIPTNHRLHENAEQFRDFLNRIQKVSQPQIGYSISNLAVLITDFISNYNGWYISARIGDNIVEFQYDEFKNLIGSTKYPASIDHCRSEVIKCNCLDWLSQEKNYYLCNHILTLFYYLWNNKFSIKNHVITIENDNLKANSKISDDLEPLDKFLDEIYFLMKWCVILEEYWDDNIGTTIDQDERKSIIYNHILCYKIMNPENEFEIKHLSTKLSNEISDDLFNNSKYESQEIAEIYNKIQEDLASDKRILITLQNLTKQQRQRIVNSFLLNISKQMSKPRRKG